MATSVFASFSSSIMINMERFRKRQAKQLDIISDSYKKLRTMDVEAIRARDKAEMDRDEKDAEGRRIARNGVSLHN